MTKAIDPLLLQARAAVKATLSPDSHARCNCRKEIDAGEWDAGHKVRAVMHGLRNFSSWQPIDTAPEGNDTDGPFFDVAWAGSDRRVIGCYKCPQHGGVIMLCHGYPAVWTVFQPQPTHWTPQPALPKERADYEISDDGVMTATSDWKRDDEATSLRLRACHSVDVPMELVSTWSDDQVKQADIWAWSCALSASDHDDIQVPQKPDFIPEAKSWSDRHPITGEPL